MNDKEKQIERLKGILGLEGDTGFIDVNPAKAIMLLEFNDKNRPISKSTVDKYAKAMRDGYWRKDSNAITIDNDGLLSNGQHRLLAIVKANVSVPMLFAFGVDNHSEMDRGKQRSVVDNIGLSKKFEGKEIANHKDLHKIAVTLTRLFNNGKAETYETENTLYYLDDKLLEAKELGLFKAPRQASTRAVSCALFVAYLNGVNEELLLRIREILNSGVSMGVYDSPIIGLRDNLNNTKGGGTTVEKTIYRRTMYCIEAVEKGHKTKRCLETTEPKYTINFKNLEMYKDNIDF